MRRLIYNFRFPADAAFFFALFEAFWMVGCGGTLFLGSVVLG